MIKSTFLLPLLICLGQFICCAQEADKVRVILMGETGNTETIVLYLDGQEVGREMVSRTFVYSFCIDATLVRQGSVLAISSRKGLSTTMSNEVLAADCQSFTTASTVYLNYDRVRRRKVVVECLEDPRLPIEIYSTNLTGGEIHELKSGLGASGQDCFRKGQIYQQKQFVNSTISKLWVESTLTLHADSTFTLHSGYYLSKKKRTLIDSDSLSGTWSHQHSVIRFSNGFRYPFKQKKRKLLGLHPRRSDIWRLVKDY